MRPLSNALEFARVLGLIEVPHADGRIIAGEQTLDRAGYSGVDYRISDTDVSETP